MKNDDKERLVLLAIGIMILTAVLVGILGLVGYLKQIGVTW